MSDDKKLPEKIERTTDLTPKDQEIVTKFIADGMPGLAAVDDVMIARIYSAYLDGKSHRETASVMRTTKGIVLYLADRFNWFQRRQEYRDELALTMQNRMMERKLDNKDILIYMSQYYSKRLRKKMDRFYETENEDPALEPSKKDVDSLLKTIKALNELDDTGKDPKTGKPPISPVGINIPDGATVTRNDDGSVDISPKEKAQVDMLMAYSNYRREQDALRSKKSSDIKETIPQENNSETKPQGDKG